MPIFWRPQFRIGQDDIDADHRYLILLINTVELVLRFPDDPRNVDLALIELRRYAEYHFEREERIQISTATSISTSTSASTARCWPRSMFSPSVSAPRSTIPTAAWRASRRRAARSPPSCASGWWTT